MIKPTVLLQATVGVGIGFATLLACGRLQVIPALSMFAESVAVELAEPCVVTDRAEWDFGEVRSGQLLEATFELRNLGRRRLIVQRMNGDCDCVSTAAAIIIEPGGHRTVVATLDPSKFLGPVKIGIHYKTNDPKRPRLTLFGLANIVTR